MHWLFKDFRHPRWLSPLAIILICTGCVRENHLSIERHFEEKYLSSLPLDLQGSAVQFKQILNDYENLNAQQKAAALEHFLDRKYIDPSEQIEASYVLGRLYKQDIQNTENKKTEKALKAQCKEAIALFDLAKSSPALKQLSSWHIIEIATISGDEKLIRQIVNEMKEKKPESGDMAAIDYALAQSYLRTFENEKAISLLQTIRLQSPGTNYAIAASYYLANLELSKWEAAYKIANINTQAILRQENSVLFKIVIANYLEYLQASSNGRFSKDILSKLKIFESKYNLHFNENQMGIMANAYFANGSFDQALSNWRRANSEKYAFEIANCLLVLGNTEAAQQYLFIGLAKYPHDKRYFSIANQISNKLSKAASTQLWGKLHNNKLSLQDQVLWNMAIREPLPKSLALYQNLLKYYPTSSYAAEAQWRLFWQKYKASKGHSLLAVADISKQAANKYSDSKLAPRFLYWTAKIYQGLGDKQQASLFYEKTADAYPMDYYGQRARVQLSALQGGRDNYFTLQEPFAAELKDWHWPTPENELGQIRAEHKDALYLLIQLKQYDEALGQSNDAPVILKSWLLAKNDQPLLAINTAVKQIHDEQHNGQKPKPSTTQVYWQYAYPLLYNQQINASCRGSNIKDPLLLHALIREESRYNPYAISQSNALGLSQLMPTTAAGVANGMGLQLKSNSDLFHPELNIQIGARYLSNVLKTLSGNSLLAVASYNAGINAVKNKISDKEKFVISDADIFVEDFPYRETRDYIRKVFNSYWLYREIYSNN